MPSSSTPLHVQWGGGLTKFLMKILNHQQTMKLMKILNHQQTMKLMKILNHQQTMKRNILILKIPNNWSRRLVGASLLAIAFACNNSFAYPRYNDVGAGGGCSDCHGVFTGSISPKGTVFPSSSKHEMHRAAANMNTDCNLCHTAGDNRNPFIGSSDGTANNPGWGCTGCHVAEGLRAHHAANGIADCAGCHTDGPAAAENVNPPYYGTVDTKANNPGNTALVANTNENWSVGDFLGLDNDGNNLYDLADFAVGPYRLLSVNREGNNVRVTWLTAGGRTDAVQASGAVAGLYSNVSPPLAIPGVGLVTTNHVEVGGATNTLRFYRLKFVP